MGPKDSDRRTLIVRDGSNRFVFRDGEIDALLAAAHAADSVAEAWRRLDVIAEYRSEPPTER